MWIPDQGVAPIATGVIRSSATALDQSNYFPTMFASALAQPAFELPTVTLAGHGDDIEIQAFG
jgi:hypothetical protein